MKKICIILALMLGISAMAAPKETVTPAGDSRITFVGRTLVQDGNVSFDWTGVYARVAFEGRYLAVRVSDTKKNYYNVWLDREMTGEPDKIVATAGQDSLLVLFDATEIKTKGPHRVAIQKRTEAEQGRTTFHSFITQGALLQAEGLRPRLLEFVGDSYTCGYGSENSVRTDPFKPETENANKTYATIISRYFGADYILAAHSGQGIARNYDDGGRGWHMPDRYGCLFDCDKDGGAWQGGGYKPAMTVVYLCTNDFSCGRQPNIKAFKDNYFRLLRQIKDNYGENHPVLCVAGPSDEQMRVYIKEVVDHCGMPAVWMMALCPMAINWDSDLGASWHPAYPGHKKWAHAILPYVSTITGWPLEDKVLE